MDKALFPPGALERTAAWYADKFASLVEMKSFTLSGKPYRGVDIVRDVINHVPVHWLATEVVRDSRSATRFNAHDLL